MNQHFDFSLRIGALLLLVSAFPDVAASQPGVDERCAQPSSPRPIAVLSDLHLGPGKMSSYEDFHWPRALAGLLRHVDEWSGKRADLVIAGDLFEMWQHPSVLCRGGGKNHGCTVAQMEEIAERIAGAHAGDLKELGSFASRGENRLIVVPGNHDAALMIDSVWQKVFPKFQATPGRVCRATSGTWVSGDGYVLVEHGHQIGIDVNRFPAWPKVTSRRWGRERMFKTWGESFVQELYNTVEDDYPLIDNLQPLTSGLANYLRNEGVLKALPRDLARFITFNLLETSWRQKITLAPPARGSAPPWNVDFARYQGHKLFADAMADGDPLRMSLLADRTRYWQEVRKQLDTIVMDRSALPEEEVLFLCDQIAILAESSEAGRTLCTDELSGALLQKLIPEQRRMASHLNELKRTHRDLEIFVYGHTHSLRACWEVPVNDGSVIPVFNTGAFHRLVDKDMFEALAKNEKMTPKRALAELPLKRLPACYPVVLVRYEEGIPKGDLRQWYMEEESHSGALIPACDSRCALINEDLCRDAPPGGEPCVDG